MKNVCSICKQKNLSVDFSKIKILKIKNFINNNRINKDDYSQTIKKCNCNELCHKMCILLNIIFNFELKCQNCNSFYNIKITKESDKVKKIKTIILMIFLCLIHLILFGLCAGLIIFNVETFEISKFKEEDKNKFTYMQYYFAFVLFVINIYLLHLSIKILIGRFKDSYKYFININEKSSNNIDDTKYFLPLYNFYKAFNNDRLRYLVCKRNNVFFSNRVCFNKDCQNFIKKNNDELQDLSNGNKNFPISNNNEEDLLKLKDNNNI